MSSEQESIELNNCIKCDTSNHMTDCTACMKSAKCYKSKSVKYSSYIKFSTNIDRCKNLINCKNCCKSSSLKNCTNCYNCENCENCKYCYNCKNLKNCIGCCGISDKTNYLDNEFSQKELIVNYNKKNIQNNKYYKENIENT